MRQADRGAWLRGEQMLTALSGRVGDAPAVWHNLAVLRSWLGREEAAAEAWRRYAALDVPLDDAVEAEATALEMDTLPACEAVEVVRITYSIRDMERVIAAAKTDPRCVEYPLDLRCPGRPSPRRAARISCSMRRCPARRN